MRQANRPMMNASHAARSVRFVSAVVGASFAGAAHAGPVSTAPAGFTPVTIAGGTSPAMYDIDLDQDGQADLRVTGGLDKVPPGIQFDATLTAPNISAVFPIDALSNVQAFASPDDFIDISGIGGGSNNGYLSNFTAATPYGEIGLIENATDGQIGYIKGINDPSTGTFLLQDYGLIEVPEPGSLALLAAGAAGLAAFRRRKAATPA